jgi:hypothetical protein
MVKSRRTQAKRCSPEQKSEFSMIGVDFRMIWWLFPARHPTANCSGAL